jgi:hypothetical protein
MYNGIKVDGKLYKGFWSRSGYVVKETGKVCMETVTFYVRGYQPLPKGIGFNVQNDTDIMTDYIDSDRIRFTPDHINYKNALQAWSLQESRNAKRLIAKYEKRIAGGTANKRVIEYLQEARERLAKLTA